MDPVAFVLSPLPPPPARVLEVGCGAGELALALDAAGYDVVAVDPRAPDGPIFRQTTLAELDDSGPFEVAVARYSLHHIHDLDDAVDRIASLLAARREARRRGVRLGPRRRRRPPPGSPSSGGVSPEAGAPRVGRRARRPARLRRPAARARARLRRALVRVAAVPAPPARAPRARAARARRDRARRDPGARLPLGRPAPRSVAEDRRGLVADPVPERRRAADPRVRHELAPRRARAR